MAVNVSWQEVRVQGAYAFIGKAEDVEKVGVVMAEGYATAARGLQNHWQARHHCF